MDRTDAFVSIILSYNNFSGRKKPTGHTDGGVKISAGISAEVKNELVVVCIFFIPCEAPADSLIV